MAASHNVGLLEQNSHSFLFAPDDLARPVYFLSLDDEPEFIRDEHRRVGFDERASFRNIFDAAGYRFAGAYMNDAGP